MKKIVILSVLSTACLNEAFAGEMTVQFNGKGWDGIKVPQGEICRQYGGAGSTPPLKITNIPKGADKIRTEFNAEDYARMANGGHGILLFDHNGSQQAVLKPVAGETNEMPKGTTLVSANRWSGYGYLPPCSGGTGSRYSVTVRAMKGNEVLDQSTIIIGKY